MKTNTDYQNEIFRGYPMDELREVFTKVADPHNWKNPVHAVIPKVDRDKVDTALIFMTGAGISKATPIASNPNQLYIQAPGYYATIGA